LDRVGGVSSVGGPVGSKPHVKVSPGPPWGEQKREREENTKKLD
jgi:rRNA processing protein Gar1